MAIFLKREDTVIEKLENAAKKIIVLPIPAERICFIIETKSAEKHISLRFPFSLPYAQTFHKRCRYSTTLSFAMHMFRR